MYSSFVYLSCRENLSLKSQYLKISRTPLRFPPLLIRVLQCNLSAAVTAASSQKKSVRKEHEEE